MCDNTDNIALNLQVDVEKILRKSKKSLDLIRKALSSKKDYKYYNAIESTNSSCFDKVVLQNPPFGDYELRTLYAKNLVESFISQPPLCSNKRTENVPLQKDQAVMVDVSELDTRNSFEVEKDTNKNQIISQELKAEWKPIQKSSSNSKVKNQPTPRSTRTATLRAELSRHDLSKSEKKMQKKTDSAKKLKNSCEIMNISHMSRFISGKNKTGTNFFKEHSNISITYDEPRSILPERKYLSTKSKKEKLHDIKQLNDSKFNKNNVGKIIKFEQDCPSLNLENCNRANHDNNIDATKSSTWHDVFLLKNKKASIGKAVLQREGTKILQMKKPKNGSSELLKQYDLSEDIVKSESNFLPPKQFIDLGKHTLTVTKELDKNFKKLSMKTLPVLCIKGECQVQKLTSLDIQPKYHKEQIFNKKSQSNLSNIKFEEFIHGVEKTPSTVSQSEEQQGHTSIKDPNNIWDVKEPQYKKKGNKYLTPFIKSDSNCLLQQDSYNQLESDSDSYETLSSTSTKKCGNLNSNELLESSSQTDEQKLQSKTERTVSKNRMKKIASRRTEIKLETEVLDVLEKVMSTFVNKFQIELKDLKLVESEVDLSNCDKSNVHDNSENLVKLSSTPQKQPFNLDSYLCDTTLENISNKKYADHIFQKILLDETEGVKDYKLGYSNKINAISSSATQHDVCIQTDDCSKILDFQKQEDYEENLICENEIADNGKNTNKKADGLIKENKMTEACTDQKNVDRRTNNFLNDNQNNKSSPFILEALDDSISILSESEFSKGSYILSTVSKELCPLTCHVQRNLKLHCDMHQNFETHKYESYQNGSKWQYGVDKKHLKKQNEEKLFKFANSYFKPEGCSNHSLNVSENCSLSELDNRPNKNTNIFLKTGKHKVFTSFAEKKSYNPEVKRAVRNFLSSLDINPNDCSIIPTNLKSQSKTREKCMKPNFIKNKLDIFSSFSSDFSSEPPSFTDRHSKINVQKENQSSKLTKIQKKSTFLVKDKSSNLSNKIQNDDSKNHSRCSDVSLEILEQLNSDLLFTTSSSSDNSLSLLYNKMRSKFSSNIETKEKIKLKQSNDKENYSEGEILSLGEI